MRKTLTLALACAVAACSPVACFRPASGLMPEKKLELGLGAAAISPRPYVNESWQGTGQAWLTGNYSELVTLSAIGAFDDSALALGGAMRLNLVRGTRIALGVEPEVGYAWGAISLPAALRVFGQSWLYTAPRLGTWSSDPLASVPLGFSLHVQDGFLLRAEAQVSWQDFKYYNRRTHLGLAIAYQF